MRPNPLAVLALSALAAAQMPSSSAYTDKNTGITFTGFADGTGYQFGMVLPQTLSSDFVMQLISPLTQGAGWAGVDFGSSMTGRLLVVAWPNGNDVMIAPRFATGYEVPDTVVYDGPGASAISLSPIKSGTFVNSTHVVATFVCGGCMNADSFTASNVSQSGASTLSYAYSSVAVATPSDINTQLSDHTTGSEPYGPFGLDFAEAQSAHYATYAAMAAAASGSGTSTTTGTAAGGAATASPTEAGSQASSTSSSDDGSDGTTSVDGNGSLSAGMIVLLMGMGVVYMIQPFI